jgi:hypothetical protein
MDARNPTGLDTYRLLITRREGSEILAVGNGPDWFLPLTEIPSHQRLAEQLTAAIRKTFELESCCLFIASPHSSNRSGPSANYAVMESVKPNGPCPAGTCWMPAGVFDRCCDAGEAEGVRKALVELNSYAVGEKPGPFGRAGWLRELFQWAQEQTAPLGLRLTGSFQQLNASPTFSLIRLETDGIALWFKATGKPNEHELAITLSVARLFPRHVPRILGIQRSWNGWLSAEVSGTALDEISDCLTWERVAGELAELQIASIGKSRELLDGKCKDFRVTEISKFIDPFLSRMADFMVAQEKTSPAPLAKSELASLGEGLKESCSLLQSFGLPDTIGHIDFNPGNILVPPGQCVFLDWAEGCVTNPVITFEYLRRHMERGGVKETPGDSRLCAAYLRPWAAFFSPDDLRRALAVAPAVAVFVHAIAGDTWLTLDPVSNPAFAGYFRSLTRRMYRDAARAAEGSELCLS